MSDKEREPVERARPAGAADGGVDDTDAARESAENLLRAADDVIARALSRDSERFLQATRQAGGQ